MVKLIFECYWIYEGYEKESQIGKQSRCQENWEIHICVSNSGCYYIHTVDQSELKIFDKLVVFFKCYVKLLEYLRTCI